MPETTVGMGQQGRAERERFENEVRRIVEAGSGAGVTLRLLGSLAFQFHCPEYGFLQEKMGRAYTDIDFAGYGKEAKNVRALMAGLGYGEDKEVWVVSEGGRAIFNHTSLDLHVDVFYEKLDFCHAIYWKDRLEVDSPTIPLAELLLEKMQIVQINEKDVIDTIMLLLEHPLGDVDKETINIKLVAELCAKEWGLWRTTTMNLDKVKQLAQHYSQLDENQKTHVTSHVNTILTRLNDEPKPLAWRIRDRVGDRVKWYRDVDEV
jgi:hypothetical protein